MRVTTVDDRCRLFFFDFFSTSSNFLGRPGGVREGILGAPGVSRGHFGRALGGLGAILERLFEQSDFKSIF